MTKQFIDMRISSQSADDANTSVIPAFPGILIGDIGIQTTGVLPENLGDIRVNLNGYAKISGLDGGETLTIRVFRDLTTSILVTSFLNVNLTTYTFGFSAVDFPPEIVAGQGQIRYTATIDSTSNATLGAANFSGLAAAGTTTEL
ncbi:hypothetical protein HQN89_07370 [Paenibacillus frigoriresistens]|uniref:hypothetical protein n=1 Tax=Paenibacillus alginolyticus TaxID=59839 RepID=UPI00156333FA|nr:hypothetical protein [Paenibacillus frigoriresistens]NRF90847.1 hypothetical protein [Paenibacillus frigoriresistens]